MKATKSKKAKTDNKIETAAPISESLNKVAEVEIKPSTKAKKLVTPIPISISEIPVTSAVEAKPIITPKKTIVPELVAIDQTIINPPNAVDTQETIATLIPKKKIAPVLVTPTKSTSTKSTPTKLPQNVTPITSFFTKK